jgi:hypothetical protein
MNSSPMSFIYKNRMHIYSILEYITHVKNVIYTSLLQKHVMCNFKSNARSGEEGLTKTEYAYMIAFRAHITVLNRY